MSLGNKKPKSTLSKEVKRGVLNSGFDYEKLIPAYFALKLISDPTVETFSLKINSSSYRKFDDLIATIENVNNSIDNFAFQLKHRQPGRDKLNAPDEFMGKKSEKQNKNFNISDYCKAYYKEKKEVQESHKFVLFTNAKFENVDQDTNFMVKQIDKPFLTDSFNTGTIYQLNERVENIEECDFYDKFYLLSNQKNVDQLREAIKDIFVKKFYSDVNTAICYIDFFETLRAGKYTNTEITKDEVILKLVDLLVSKWVIDIPFTEKQCSKIKILEEAIKEFDVTLIEHADKTVISNQWQYLYSNHIIDNDRIQLTHFKLLTNDNSLPDRELKTKILTYFRQKPLFVEVTKDSANTVYVIVDICRKLDNIKIKFALVGDKIDRSKFSDWKVFRHLADLKFCQGLYKKFTDLFKVSLQGRKHVSIPTLASEHSIYLDDYVVVKDMIQYEDILPVGNEIDSLPEPFIQRRLLLTSFNIKFLKHISKEEPVVLYCEGDVDSLKKSLEEQGYKNLISLLNYKQNPSKYKGSVIILTDKLDKTCSDKFLLVKRTDKCTLECIKVTGQLVSKASESLTGRLNVITGDPGIGKSTLMKYLAKNSPLDHWIVIVPLRQLIPFLQDKYDSAEILEYFLQSENNTNRGIIEHFRKKKQVVFLFDSLDELSRDTTERAIKIVKQLANDGYKVRIFCTKFLLPPLRKSLDVDFIYNVDELSKDDQISYLRDKLTTDNTDSIDVLIENIFGNQSSDVNILKLPLFIYILTEILNKNRFNDVQDILTSAKMHAFFIEEKFQHYFSKINLNDSLHGVVKNVFKDFYIKEYQIAALKTCLEPSHFKTLSLKNDSKFINQMKVNDVLGLVLKVTDEETFIFAHHTIAEYFAGMWFSENYTHINKKKIKLIFHQKYIGIRRFFDMKLAEDCPLHLAILKQDVRGVKKLAAAHLKDRDKGGRSPLHLASSVNKFYPLLTENSDFEAARISPSQILLDREQILDVLLQLNADPLSEDSIFKWNSFQYAEACSSMFSVNKLLKKAIPKLQYLCSFQQKYNDDGRPSPPHLNVAIVRNFSNLAKYFIEHNIGLDDIDHKKHTPLHESAFWGQTDIVKLLLEKGKIDVNAKTSRGKSPLCFAAKMGYKDIIRLLLEHGADVNTTDMYERTPLEKASYMGSTDIVKFLIEHGAKVNSQNIDKNTPLIRAANMGNTETVKCLLEHGADTEIVDIYKRTVLHVATYEGHTEVVKLLVDRGSNIFAEDEESKTALQIAKEKGFTDIVEILEEAQKHNCSRNTSAIMVGSSLHEAAEADDLEKIRQLLAEGADVNETDNQHKQTVLHIACYRGNEELVTLLLEKGADLNIENLDGRYPLHLASQRGHSSIIKKLLQHDKNQVKIVDKRWQLTPLHRAAQKGHKEAVEILIAYGIDPNTTYVKGETSLHSAARGGQNDILDYLIFRGADINCKNKSGETCLHLAAQMGCTETVEHIVDRYPEILNEVDFGGRTALHWAVEKGYKRMVQILVQAGINVYIKDNHRESALDTARHFDRDQIIEYLEKYQQDIGNNDKPR